MSEILRVGEDRWEHGPKIVAIGGGTGLSTMLRGLKLYTKNLTAVVTVADDGGGSGKLRQDLGILPPGDIRNCMQALANVEPIMQQLMNYRFESGSLKGQSFGNLLLAALTGISTSFDQAVSKMSQVLAITGRVLPVTNSDVQLKAKLDNGMQVIGESEIPQVLKKTGGRIQKIQLIPEKPPALPDALKAIKEADIILLGPGSLYTSVIPNLCVNGVSDAIRKSTVPRVYICNIMTQDGETEGYSAADHLDALFAHAGSGIVDCCLVNSQPITETMKKKYKLSDSEPIRIDRERIASMGIELIERPLASEKDGLVRHDEEKLAAAVMEIYEKYGMRVF